MKMLSKIFRWVFVKYEEDFVSPYVHNGVGYTGIEHDLYYGTPGRIKHSGVGYTGVYDE